MAHCSSSKFRMTFAAGLHAEAGQLIHRADTANVDGAVTEHAGNYTQRQIPYLMACLMLCLLLVSFNQTVLNTALPTIVGDLGEPSKGAWLVAGFVLAVTVSMPIYGSVSDVIGRKGLLLTAIAIFSAGSIAAALAQSMDYLIICRVVQGLGAGGLMVLSQTILADAVPARQRAAYAGVFGSVWLVAAVSGALIGGLLTDGPGWEWAFWINVPLGAVTMILAVRFIRASVILRIQARPDYLGIVLLLVSTVGIVFLATWGGRQLGWSSPTTIVILVATVLSATLFVVVEGRAAQPIMPLSLFRNRIFILATVAAILTAGVGIFTVLTYLPTYLQMSKGLNALEAGWVLLPMIFSVVTASMLTGFAVTKTGGYKLILVVGASIMACGLALLSGVGPATPIVLVCLYSSLVGVGIGTSIQLLPLVVQNALPVTIIGAGTAGINYFKQAGAAIGISAFGSILAPRLSSALENEFGKLGTSTAASGIDPSMVTPALLAQLPPPVLNAIEQAYGQALPPLFLWIVPFILIAVVSLALLPERPLHSAPPIAQV